MSAFNKFTLAMRAAGLAPVEIADQINNHVEQAATKASEAIHHAIEAGKLLLEVKASLEHGQFGAWLETNAKFSARQAQRYIAAAEGKPPQIRALTKNDTVSYLTHDDEKAKAVREYFKPTWEPIPGHQMVTTVDDVDYWVTASLAHPGYFHITTVCEPGMSFKLGACSSDTAPEDMDGNLQFTKREIHSASVEDSLVRDGLKDPAKQSWKIIPVAGCVAAFGNVVLPPVQTPAATDQGGAYV
jgi:hypothetical protein